MTTADVPAAAEVARFADQLERSFRGGAWHGPALAEVLEGVDAAAAARRPIPGAHSIAELTFHVAYWIEAAQRRIHGSEPDDTSPDADWRTWSQLSPEAWRELVDGLEASQRKLHEAVAALDAAQLDDPVAGSDPTVRGMLLGVLQHTAYHAGQISLLRRALEPVAAETTSPR